MRTSVMLEPQIGMSYAQILAMAKRAESAGCHGLYRSDHYHQFSREGVDSTDAWATLAGLARETSQIVLGTMVTPVTFRTVGNLARVVGTIAEMAGNRSDGTTRIHLGLGTGWFEPEHRQHGFPFEDLGTRFRRLEEHLQVIRGLWTESAQPFSFDGEFVDIANATFAPIPDPVPRVIVGGRGERRTPTLAATHADELNVVMLSPDKVAARAAVTREVAEELGRAPVDITSMGPAVLGVTTREAEDRLARLADQQGEPADKVGEWVRSSGLYGTLDQAAARLGEYAAAGVSGFVCQHVLADDLDMVDLVAELGTD